MIHVNDGKKHNVNILDDIELEINAFYHLVKGYTDFGRLFKIDQFPAFFVISGKDNIQFKRASPCPVNKIVGLRCDQKVNQTVYKTSILYPNALRRVNFMMLKTKIQSFPWLIILKLMHLPLLYATKVVGKLSYSSNGLSNLYR